ncbi:hypothetical protein MJO28_013149 [Puccinia striiformis f. sp. tritici]|uniref:Uncharacterized protein n=1 Tax=Puccinia striiformis f. sp. tritici TaxID=168172 RepID=A0ACC0DXE7_9BASI|nr:hypothetical protein MJO28_013149 [Puccinia striiformis f. sp. tritici]
MEWPFIRGQLQPSDDAPACQAGIGARVTCHGFISRDGPGSTSGRAGLRDSVAQKLRVRVMSFEITPKGFGKRKHSTLTQMNQRLVASSNSIARYLPIRRLQLIINRRAYGSVSSAYSKPVDGFTGTIGNTPLIHFKRLSEQTGCEIFGKAEFLNPGGSVKDRAALWIIKDAEERGILKPGGTVVEGTAGNTGIGLAHLCRSRGYRCIIYMPNTQSPEKINVLKKLGAEVYPVPAVPFDDPQNYNHQAARCAESIENAVWTNQFDNLANRQAHIETTGPEIWEQTLAVGGIDGFICSTGTGGTLAGVTRYLKDKSNGKVQCYLADPPGSVLYNYIQSEGKIIDKREGGNGSVTEGIGQGRITENLKPEINDRLIDGSFFISDQDSVNMFLELIDRDGFSLGLSSALNLLATIKLAHKLKLDHHHDPHKKFNLVTILCDYSTNYQSKLFSKNWLKSKGLFDPIPDHLKRYAILD